MHTWDFDSTALLSTDNWVSSKICLLYSISSLINVEVEEVKHRTVHAGPCGVSYDVVVWVGVVGGCSCVVGMGWSHRKWQ